MRLPLPASLGDYVFAVPSIVRNGSLLDRRSDSGGNNTDLKDTLRGKTAQNTKRYVNSDVQRMIKAMSSIVITFLLLFVPGVIGFILVERPLLRLIKLSAVVSVPIFLGICAYQIMLGFRDCHASYFSCTNRILYLKRSAISGAVLSFAAISIFNAGVFGLISAQTISQGAYNVWH